MHFGSPGRSDESAILATAAMCVTTRSAATTKASSMQRPGLGRRVTRAAIRQANAASSPLGSTMIPPLPPLISPDRRRHERGNRGILCLPVVEPTPTNKQKNKPANAMAASSVIDLTVSDEDHNCQDAMGDELLLLQNPLAQVAVADGGVALQDRPATDKIVAKHQRVTHNTHNNLAIERERVRKIRDRGVISAPTAASVVAVAVDGGRIQHAEKQSLSRTHSARVSPDRHEARQATVPEPVTMDATTTNHEENSAQISNNSVSSLVRIGTDPIQQMIPSEPLEQLLCITKDDAKETWSFPIVCKSPAKCHQNDGAYKEATLVWHPRKVKTLRCRCCGTTTQSLRWFVEHTDATLLVQVATSDPYQYVFAMQASGALLPLEMVLRLVRRAFMDAKHNRKYQQRRGQRGRQRLGRNPPQNGRDHEQEDPTVLRQRQEPPPVKATQECTRRVAIELSSAQRDAIQTLRFVRFLTVQPTKQDNLSPLPLPLPRPDRVAPAFTCDVVAADERYLRPVHGTDGRLYRDLLAHVSCDVWKCGTLQLRKYPNDDETTIQCQCCGTPFSLSTFYDHAHLPLMFVHRQQVEDENALARGHAWPTNAAAIRALAARRIQVAVAVRMYNGTAMQLTAFLSTLATLGSQRDINAAIRSLGY